MSLSLGFLLVVTVLLSHWFAGEEAEEKTLLWLKQDVGSEPLRKVESTNIGEMWILVTSLIPVPYGENVGR